MAGLFRPPSDEHRESVELALRPGTLTVIVSSSGLTNLAVAMPTLNALLANGHKVVVFPFEGVAEGLGGTFDFIAAQDPGSAMRLNLLLERGERLDDENRTELIGSRLAGLHFAEGPASDRDWLYDLSPGDSRRPTVFLVPDLQECSPLQDWVPQVALPGPISNATLMPAQLVGLKVIALCGGVAVVGGHCASREVERDWRLVAEMTDETILVEEAGETRDGLAPAVLTRYTSQSPDFEPVEVESATIDLSFGSWRRHV